MHTRLHLICYDISDPKRLRRVAKTLEAEGIRVQKSIFEATLNFDERLALIARVKNLVNTSCDQVYFQPLCAYCARQIRWQGKAKTEAAEDFWVI